MIIFAPHPGVETINCDKRQRRMKIKIVWLVLLLAGVAASCKTSKKPQGVLSKEVMVDFLVDMYVGEARMASVSVVTDSAKKVFMPFQEALMKKKGISDSVMSITYRYYMEHPKELEEVYDVVIDTLSLREQKEGLKTKK